MLDLARENLSPEDYIDFSEDISKHAPSGLSQENLLSWQKLVLICEEKRDSFAAWKILSLAKKNFSDFSSISKEFEELFLFLFYLSFSAMPLGELCYFFEKLNFTILFRDDFYSDLIDKTKGFLINFELGERNGAREKIFDAMHKNNSIMTSKFTTPGTLGSIANWLKIYDSKIGIYVAESMRREEFLNFASRSAILSQEDLGVLRKFISFYEFIKTSSYDPHGFEEDVVIEQDGEDYLLLDGELKKLSDLLFERNKKFPNKPKEQEEDIFGQEEDLEKIVSFPLAKFPTQKEILLSSRDVLKKTKANAELVFDELFSAIEKRNHILCLGSLVLLSQIRKLDDALYDKRFYDMVALDISKTNMPEQNLEGLRANPTAPKYIARFLKTVLEEKMGFSSQDSISFGIKLSQMLSIEGEKYQSIIKDGKWVV